MKKITTFLIVGAVIAISITTAKADLIYLADFKVLAERSSLMIAFIGPIDKNGKIKMEVHFGQGLAGKTAEVKITPIRDANKFRSAMESLLKSLNNPKKIYIKIMDEMKNAGWDIW